MTKDTGTPMQGELPGTEHAPEAPTSNVTRIQRRVIETAVDIATGSEQAVIPSYLHSALCQIGFPRNRVEARSFERTNGAASLRLKAGELWDGQAWVEQPLPYGTRPRLVLVHLCSEAVRTSNPEIEVGHSVREFLGRLGIQSTGGKNGSYTLFRKQMEALAACELLIGYPTAAGPETVKAPPISRFQAWIHADEGQKVLWPGKMTLSHEFYESLREHAVPLRQDALAALKHSALALDIYSWLAHRLCRVRSSKGVRVYWTNLREQFGQEYNDPRNFKKKFQQALTQALAVYPSANVTEISGGLLLKSSPPPIPKMQVLLRLPQDGSGSS